MENDAVMPLHDFRVLTLALNVPGPIAAARLAGLGATVTKIEPPSGDPLAQACPDWYQQLSRHQEIIQLDLKSLDDRSRLEHLLEACDLLLTASRPKALSRLDLDWPTLHRHYPRLSQVAIVGSPGQQADLPGHDLTYQAHMGLLDPPALPRTLVADLAGAEQAVSAALELLLVRERGGAGGYRQVALAEAAASFAEPLIYGLTTVGGKLGGGKPEYNLYRTRKGWIALAAVEPHFWQRLQQALGFSQPHQTEMTQKDLAQCFLTRTAVDWESWGEDHDLPVVALKEPSNEQQ